MKFSCEVLEYKSKFNSSNTGFTGFTREMSQCASNGSSDACECDLGVGGWAKTRERVQLVDFVDPFAADAFRMVERDSDIKDGSKDKGIFYITVFSWGVWASMSSIFVLLIVISLFDAQYAALSREPEKSNEILVGVDSGADNVGEKGNEDEKKISLWERANQCLKRLYEKKLLYRFVLYHC
jgi:hypothetical protein